MLQTVEDYIMQFNEMLTITPRHTFDYSMI